MANTPDEPTEPFVEALVQRLNADDNDPDAEPRADPFVEDLVRQLNADGDPDA